MAVIIHARVDERLMHGQASIWMQVNGANSVIVANDDVATNQTQQDLMKVTVPQGVRISFYSLDKLIEIWPKASEWQKFYLVVKDIDSMHKLWKAGLPIKEVNIGNTHTREDRKKITSSVNLSESERALIKEMHEAGVLFNTQTLPGVTKGLVETSKLIED
ncbi:PTS sugar transporter subunit IIB [Mycoplasmopsis pullorum]|uniref:PTS sorbose transporter subunit IID n=1 Tax=Mycoplasmopsis pullorum TaxID=48003 RepID=A0A1L4FR80_9BACT|nr:PTS sugar transporter subunit IIB [Mycoplasmopsis pullorum]APJ38120.1 PTS sorbose transporter subunit IID [Mycoplasmopsis pullorum]TNK82300.1 PTS mannose/fructose/sorbose transporter subunit IIB [Mycoplasmopsis pullorum]TNK82393.1 PTS mannose/fructose/sorbose transporter subunit IIB [Mycoplasmopsis pullorum]TNK83941.1 PTS mannose/fructose/sorbose transporter subunit IIB [Mycoplasmopsis pullorum]TNK84565.1 PTS mannose/fructose/sorbose transporter subunit IIB [Mycoplasmopsis pullorum]